MRFSERYNWESPAVPLNMRRITLLKTLAYLAAILSAVIAAVALGLQLTDRPRSQPQPIHPDTSTSDSVSSPAGPGTVSVSSDPSGAEIFLDWQAMGITPQTLSVSSMSGLLLITKDGYVAKAVRVEALPQDSVRFLLEPDTAPLGSGILVLLENNTDATLESDLGAALRAIGLVPRTAPAQLLREVRRAGRPSHPVVMAWVRAMYEVGYLIDVRVTGRTRHLGNERQAKPGLRDALQGVFRADVTIKGEVLDLQRRQFIGSAVGAGSGSGLDEARAWERARHAATEGFTRKLRALIPTT